MGGINSLSGLNNVNVDFWPAVGLIKSKPDEANQPLPGADAVPENAPQPEKAEAKGVVRQLDVLLLGAASKSVSADVATNVTTIGNKLVKKGVLTQKQLSKPRISAAALKATENRLNEAIEHAKNLSLDGKVYKDADWKDRGILGMMSDIASNVKIKKSDGSTVTAKANKIECVRDYLVRECPSLYKRDYLHMMFVKPQSA